MPLFKLIDLIWPITYGETQNLRELSLTDISLNDEEIDDSLAYVLKVYEFERDRKKNVENKSLVFIAVTGVIVLLSINLGKDVFNIKQETNSLSLISYLVLFVAILFFVRTVWVSVNALKSRIYHLISFKDVLLNNENSKKELILSIINNTRKNYGAINSIVDDMNLAQRCFQRAILMFFFYILITFISSLNIFSGTYIDIELKIFKDIFVFFVIISVIFYLKLLFILLILSIFRTLPNRG